MKTNILFSAIIFITFACTNTPEGINISGTINGGKGKIIYLSNTDKTDSIVIDENNHFAFNKQNQESDFYNLYFNRIDPILLYLDSSENIIVNTDTENFSSNYNVTGSVTSTQIMQLQQKLLSVFGRIQALYNEKVLKADSTILDSVRTVFNNESNQLVQSHRMEVFDFIRKNPSSFACLPAIYQSFDSRNPLFMYEMDASYYNLIDSALMATKPNSKHTKEFHSQIVEYKQQFERIRQMESKVQAGTEAPDFEVPSPNGKMIKLSSFRGNYVLLDFWASWCSPCRQENPAVLEAYNLYKKKGFRVFQVSLDKEKNDWLTAINKDGLGEITHASDLQYWNCVPAKLYGVQSIPANFLIDPKGIVVGRNLRGNDLLNTLSQIYK